MKTAKRPTYHIVSHSHWDREWYFPFDRFRAMLVDMIEDLLVIFKRDRAFNSYTLDGQMAAVMDYLEVRPDRKQAIKNLVRLKKLFIGPWYILNDEFLSSGESMIRNLLLGFRLGKELGGVMKIGYIPDQFGHIAQMPQILRGFDMDRAMFYRGFGGEPGQDHSEYWWVAPDGSRVLLHHLPKDGYSAGYFGSKDRAVIQAVFDRMRKELDPRAASSQRLFFNGGDHHWPDEAVTTAVKVLNEQKDVHVRHSSFVDYFAAVRKELGASPRLPVLEGETRFGYRYAFVVLGGVFSSRMYLKQMNASCERLLSRSLEPLNVLAMLNGSRSRTPQIEQAWKYLIQNQDHDAICGTSSDEVHQEMVVRFNKVQQIGEHVAADCFAGLLPYDENVKKDERFLFIFNPSPCSRSEVVEAVVEFYRQDIVVGLNPDVKVEPKLPPVRAFRLERADGTVVPIQVLGRDEAFGVTYSKHNYPSQTLVDRFSILLRADSLPPLGWRGFSINKTDEFGTVSSSLRVDDRSIENDALKVTVQDDGSITLIDKANGAEFKRLNVFEDSGDVGDEYDYSYPERDKWISSDEFPPAIRVIERGPLRGAIQIDYVMKLPASAAPDERSRSEQTVEERISTVVALTPFSKRLDIRTTIENTAKDHRLRVLFDTGTDTLESHADTPFAVVKRTHQEYDVSQFPYEHPAQVAPMQRFVTLSGKNGFTLLVRGLPEYELKVAQPGMLALTLLRCVGKLSGRDLITRPGGAAGWWTETPEAQCLGTHVFEYSVFPHAPTLDSAWPAILREAEAFTNPPEVVKRKNDQENLEHSFCSIEPEGLELSALKEPERGGGFILRLRNPVGRTVEGRIHFNVPIARGTLCKLNEQPLRPVRVNRGHDLKVKVRPYEVVTIHLIPKRHK